MAATPQPRPAMVDQLDRIVPRLDELVARARLGTRSPRDYDALEHDAQAIARDLVAAFRGAAPAVAAPLRVSPCGRRALF